MDRQRRAEVMVYRHADVETPCPMTDTEDERGMMRNALSTLWNGIVINVVIF